MAGLFVVFGVLSLIFGVIGCVVGSGTSGLGAIGASAGFLLIATYMRNEEHTQAVLAKLSEVSRKLDGDAHGARPEIELPPLRPDQR